MLIVAFMIFAGIINGNERFFLSKNSPLGKLMNRRIGRPQKGFMEQDLLLIGPLNEFLSMSVMEVFGFIILLAWLAIAVYAKYRDLFDQAVFPLIIPAKIMNATISILQIS
jgi:hypothetical protein